MMYASFSKQNFIAKHYLKDTILPYGCCKIKKTTVVTNIFLPKLFWNIIQKRHYFFGTQSKKDITFSEYNPPKVYK